MKVIFTDEEKREQEAIEAKYDKLLQEYSTIVDTRDQSEIRSKQPDLPIPKNGKYDEEYIYSQQVQQYSRQLSEYIEMLDRWISEGSPEWQDAYKIRSTILQEWNDRRQALFAKAERRQFAEIGDDPSDILQNAYDQINEMILSKYEEYVEQFSKNGSVLGVGLRVDKKNDRFYLDAETMIERARKSLHLHFKALQNDQKRTTALNIYLIKTISESQYVSSTEGVLGAILYNKNADDQTRRTGRPISSFVMPVDRISRELFAGNIHAEYDAEGDLLAHEIILNGARAKRPITALVSVDYSELLKSGIGKDGMMPQLDADARLITNALISHWVAGNRFLSIEDIYRAMTGKTTGDVHMTEDQANSIKSYLPLLTTRVWINRKTRNGREFEVRGPIIDVHEARSKDEDVYLIEIIHKPLLLIWAEQNGYEIDTRDIKLLDVPGIYNSKDSRNIRSYLYERIITMVNAYKRAEDRKKAMKVETKIKFETMYEKIGASDPTRTEKSRIKKTVDKCLSYWVSMGLIPAYEYTKVGKQTIDGVRIILDTSKHIES